MYMYIYIQMIARHCQRIGGLTNFANVSEFLENFNPYMEMIQFDYPQAFVVIQCQRMIEGAQSPPKCIGSFRFHEIIIRRWARIPRV